MPARRALCMLAVAMVTGSGVGMAHAGDLRRAAGCASRNWSQYGDGPRHSFSVPAGCSDINARTVARLLPKWFFHTTDSITASPAVVGDTVYVGSWDSHFYALNAATGKPRWVATVPKSNPTAFGDIVSSAAVQRFYDAQTGGSRLIAVFGDSSVLWALDARTGHVVAHIDLDPRKPALRAKQQASANPPVVEIESSPAVADVRVGRSTQRRIYVGLDVHNDPKVGRTGVVSLRLVARHDRWMFVPVWKSDAETNRTYHGRAGLTRGSGQGFGCGDVWSSPAVDPASGVLTYGVGNCDDPGAAKAAHQNWSQAIVAVRASSGMFLWRYAPAEHANSPKAGMAEAYADDDFGASPNLFRARGGLVVGDGCKNAVYYARDAATGAARWHEMTGTPGNLQQNFAVGGFIGSTAVAASRQGQATHIIGASAIPVPHNASELIGAAQNIRSLDPATGAVQWAEHLGAPTYAAASVVNDVVLVPITVGSVLLALDLRTGLPIWSAPVAGPPSSTAVVSGNSVYLGTGTNETDLEYKALGLTVPASAQRAIGQSPLSPASGVQAFTLP